MSLSEEVEAIEDIDINKTYNVILNGMNLTVKAHIMYILEGYYRDERLIVYRFYKRKTWNQELLNEREFKFRIYLGLPRVDN